MAVWWKSLKLVRTSDMSYTREMVVSYSKGSGKCFTGGKKERLRTYGYFAHSRGGTRA